MMKDRLHAIAEDTRFQNFITGAILFAGVLVGIETYPAAVAKYGTVLHLLDQAILWIFVAEVVIKMGAEGAKPWRYFKDPWNVFDFVIVAACFLPFAGSAATVLRLLRLLRVLKLVRALPKLQLLVGALLKSIPSMGYVSILLFLLFYVYGVAAVFMWGANDPVHFADLEIAMVSLFRTVTLEDWTDLMYIQMYGCDKYGYDGMQAMCTKPSASPIVGAAFFVSFVLFGTMIILNLFIGVIMNGMSEAQEEAEAEHRARTTGGSPSLEGELALLREQLALMSGQLANVERAAAAAQRSTDESASSEPLPSSLQVAT